jgi:hypothetical protein
VKRLLLALVATLLTPWLGPHVDQYVPMGWVLIKAPGNAPGSFWVLAVAACGVVYLVWLGVFTAVAAWLASRRRHRRRLERSP